MCQKNLPFIRKSCIREEGRVEERLSGIELALDVKFGSEGLQLMSTISETSDLVILRTIYKYVLTANTFDQLRELIQNVYASEIY